MADKDRWFSYYYWLNDDHAPDFAPTVDIRRKPGYDPVELFLDPDIRFPEMAVGWRLAKRKLGMRTLLDVISVKDTQLVKGSHGRPIENRQDGPLVISSEADKLSDFSSVNAVDFKRLVLDHTALAGRTSNFWIMKAPSSCLWVPGAIRRTPMVFEIDTENEDYDRAEIVNRLHMVKSRHPVAPLFEGEWE